MKKMCDFGMSCAPFGAWFFPLQRAQNSLKINQNRTWENFPVNCLVQVKLFLSSSQKKKKKKIKKLVWSSKKVFFEFLELASWIFLFLVFILFLKHKHTKKRRKKQEKVWVKSARKGRRKFWFLVVLKFSTTGGAKSAKIVEEKLIFGLTERRRWRWKS